MIHFCKIDSVDSVKIEIREAIDRKGKIQAMQVEYEAYLSGEGTPRVLLEQSQTRNEGILELSRRLVEEVVKEVEGRFDKSSASRGGVVLD